MPELVRSGLWPSGSGVLLPVTGSMLVFLDSFLLNTQSHLFTRDTIKLASFQVENR